MTTPHIEAIFIATQAGGAMTRVHEIEAIAGVGLCADRYATGAGYYSRRDEGQLTLIEGEALDRMKSIHGVRLQNSEHSRNLVTRGLAAGAAGQTASHRRCAARL